MQNDVGQLTLLTRDLQNAGALVDQKIPDLLLAEAQKVISYAQQFAPVKTGALRNSIRILAQSRMSITVGTDIKYGVYQEFGTLERGEFATTIRKQPIRGRRVSTTKAVKPRGVPPHPYMRPALQQVGDDLNQQFGDVAVASIVKGPNA